MIRWAWSLAIPVLCSTIPAHAEDTTIAATNLKILCDAKTPACDSFFIGFYFGVLSQHTPPYGMICFPEGAGALQAELVVEKYMRDHPELLHQDAAALTTLILAHAFPCRKSN